MEKSTLVSLIRLNYSSHDISKETNKSQTTVRYWLKKYKLKTKIPFYQGGNKKKWSKRSKIKCSCCGKDKSIKHFYAKPNGYHTHCKECLKDNVTKRQQAFKIKCVEYKGGECVCCGYKKYIGALEFHHRNPKQKDFEISRSVRNGFNEKVKKELDKCELVCSNCHKEIHAGLREIPENKTKA